MNSLKLTKINLLVNPLQHLTVNVAGSSIKVCVFIKMKTKILCFVP